MSNFPKVLCVVVIICGLAWVKMNAFADTLPYTPIVTPNGSTLPWKMVEGGIKEFHLIVEQIEHEIYELL